MIQKMTTNQPSHGIVSIVSSYRYSKSNVLKKIYIYILYIYIIYIYYILIYIYICAAKLF